MKKVLLLSFLTVCLAGTTQAGLAVFSFDSVGSPALGPGAGDAAIGSYMTLIYGSTVEVSGATTYPYGTGSSEVNPLPLLSSGSTDGYVADAGSGSHQFTISFSVPIASLSFDWARGSDPFQVEASYGDRTIQIFSVESGGNGGSGTGRETINLLDPAVFGSPVTTLFIHDGGQGAIGIDNLAVSPVPLPASILLGAFAVGLAGRKLREFV